MAFIWIIENNESKVIEKYLLEFQLHTYTKKVEHVHFGNNSLLKVGMHFNHT